MKNRVCAEVQSKVLIVDDEADIRFLFGKILLKRNLKTGYAKDLAEAYISIQADPPYLIFLDNSLPDGLGIDFIPFLKKNYPRTRIVMVTANDSLAEKYKALQQGADEFLGKPLSLDLIYRTLDKIEDLSQSV
jgi:two-component system OmpR family response regulator